MLLPFLIHNNHTGTDSYVFVYKFATLVNYMTTWFSSFVSIGHLDSEIPNNITSIQKFINSSNNQPCVLLVECFHFVKKCVRTDNQYYIFSENEKIWHWHSQNIREFMKKEMMYQVEDLAIQQLVTTQTNMKTGKKRSSLHCVDKQMNIHQA